MWVLWTEIQTFKYFQEMTTALSSLPCELIHSSHTLQRYMWKPAHLGEFSICSQVSLMWPGGPRPRHVHLYLVRCYQVILMQTYGWDYVIYSHLTTAAGFFSPVVTVTAGKLCFGQMMDQLNSVSDRRGNLLAQVTAKSRNGFGTRRCLIQVSKWCQDQAPLISCLGPFSLMLFSNKLFCEGKIRWLPAALAL